MSLASAERRAKILETAWSEPQQYTAWVGLQYFRCELFAKLFHLAAAERVDQIVGEYEATALRLGETLVGELFNTVAPPKVPPRRSRRREARTYATNRSLTRVDPGTAVYRSRSLTPSAASTASSMKKLPVQAALSRVRTA
jgi:hypothetical protein